MLFFCSTNVHVLTLIVSRMSYSNQTIIGSRTLFTWTIKNLNMCTEKTTQRVISPEFSHFAQQMEKFYIALYPRGREPDVADYLSVFLFKKPSSETECDTVYYYEIRIIATNGKRSLVRGNGPIKMGFGIGLSKFLDRTSLLSTDADLTLYCDISTKRSADHRETTSPNAQLLELSESFRKSYEEGFLTDMSLQTKGETLRVHRAMIQARFPGLAKKADSGLANIEGKTAGALLRYIYTGRLNTKDLQFLDLVSSPDISSHMKSLFGVRWREIKAETTISRTRVSFKWEVKHFRSLTSDDVVKYSMSDSDFQRWTWLDFSLSISKTLNGDDVLFSVTRNSRECKRIVCKISALDRHKTFEHTFGEEDCWKIPVFAQRREVVRKDSDEACFLFEISLTDGNSTSCLNSIQLCPYSSSSSDIADDLESFRDDLGMMLKSCTHSDFVLTVGGQRFPCHRFVLAARSQGFRKMFETRKTLQQVYISDVRPGSVESMLRYLYTDGIDDFPDMKQNFDLFELANQYDIPGLKKEIVRRMKFSLSTDTLGEVLVAADRWNDAELKRSVFNFVCTVPKLVLESTQLQQILRSNSDLAVEIMNRALACLAGGNNGSKTIEEPD